MQLIAFITAPATIEPILSHLELPATPPPLAPARGPPLYDAELDQTPAWGPAGTQPQPDESRDGRAEFEFDQTGTW